LTLKASEAPAHDDDGLETPANSRSNHGGGNGPAAGGTLVAEPRVRITAETNLWSSTAASRTSSRFDTSPVTISCDRRDRVEGQ
jgi:hypothetical protein